MAIRFVREDTSHSGTRDGTSYANAWGGFAEVSWASLAAGDELRVAGPHSLAANITVGAHSGSLAAPVIIRPLVGEDDPPTLTFSGATFLNTNNRSHMVWTDLPFIGGTATCIYLNGATLQNVAFDGNSFAGGTKAIDIDSSAGQAKSNIRINYNEFKDQTGTGSAAPITWYGTTAVANTITGLQIIGNDFTNNASDEVIHLRNTAASATGFQLLGEIVISENIAHDFKGVFLRQSNDLVTSSIHGTLRARRNEIRSNTVASTVIGGGFVISGFSGGLVDGNLVDDCDGQYGGFNIFYNTGLIVARNISRNLTTPTIDACGVLVDHGNVNCSIVANESYDLAGAAAVNSGAAVMILDSTGTIVLGNLSSNCKHGLYFGAVGGGQSGRASGNVMLDCVTSGIYRQNDAATGNNFVVRRNTFSGKTGSTGVNAQASGWTGESENDFSGFTALNNANHNLGKIWAIG